MLLLQMSFWRQEVSIRRNRLYYSFCRLCWQLLWTIVLQLLSLT